jgi:hypothetical protein
MILFADKPVITAALAVMIILMRTAARVERTEPGVALVTAIQPEQGADGIPPVTILLIIHVTIQWGQSRVAPVDQVGLLAVLGTLIAKVIYPAGLAAGVVVPELAVVLARVEVAAIAVAEQVILAALVMVAAVDPM